MPRVAVEDNSRMSLRIRPEEKAMLLRAVALNHTVAKDVIEKADRVQRSGSTRQGFLLKVREGLWTRDQGFESALLRVGRFTAKWNLQYAS